MLHAKFCILVDMGKSIECFLYDSYSDFENALHWFDPGNNAKHIIFSGLIEKIHYKNEFEKFGDSQ